MDESIEATFTITRAEYVRAMRRHYRTRLRLKRDVVGGTIAVGVGAWLVSGTENTALGWFVIIAGALLFGLVLYAVFVLPHLIYRSQPKLKSEYRLIFGDGGLGFHTNEIDSHLKWSFYRAWLRDDEFYLLYHGKRDVSVIPRRALAKNADDGLAELLRKVIGPAVA